MEPQEIVAAIEAETAAYNEARESKPVAEVRAHSRKIQELRKQLSDSIAAGANPCTACGAHPIGVLHPQPTGFTRRHRGQRQVLPFEIKCLHCVQLAERKNPMDVEKFSARSTSQAAALAEWQAKHPAKS